MSITIINEGNHAALDKIAPGLQDSSLYDITLAMEREEQLLEALAAGSKIPSVVIVDPESSCLT